jgi:hypothetical protein
MEAMEDLPKYMKICYLAMLNFANEVVFDVLKDHGLNTFPYIKEAVSQKDALDCLKRGSEIIYWASLITRLSDDLGTSEVRLLQIIAIG